MTIDFGWFLPVMGDAMVIGPPARPATIAEARRFDRYVMPCFEGERSVAVAAATAVALAAR